MATPLAWIAQAGPDAWLAVWLAVVLLGLPFGVLALYKVVAEHNKHLSRVSPGGSVWTSKGTASGA